MGYDCRGHAATSITTWTHQVSLSNDPPQAGAKLARSTDEESAGGAPPGARDRPGGAGNRGPPGVRPRAGGTGPRGDRALRPRGRGPGAPGDQKPPGGREA